MWDRPNPVSGPTTGTPSWQVPCWTVISPAWKHPSQGAQDKAPEWPPHQPPASGQSPVPVPTAVLSASRPQPSPRGLRRVLWAARLPGVPFPSALS